MAELNFSDTFDEVSRIKVPPHSVEAEQNVLGGLLIDNESWERIADLVRGEDFYRTDHQLIFAAIAHLAERNEPMDALTISQLLDDRGQLEDAGGVEYLGELLDATPSATNITSYAKIVGERSVRRRMIGAANTIADMCFNPEGREAADLLDSAEQAVFEIAEGRLSAGGPESAKDLLPDLIDRLDELYKNKKSVTGLATGFTELDSMTTGLQPGDLVIVAGRPSMGKSSLGLCMCENAAMDATGKPVLIFTMEMPSQAMLLRMLSSLSRINSNDLRTGNLKPDDWVRLTSSLSMLKDMPLFIDETPSLTPTDMRARARRIARQHDHGLGLIMVDYLQLMRVAGFSSDNRTGEISEISRSLKALAKEMRCPVIALAQLNRSLESRGDKRPIMSDLRESGAIEQDADLILFIYRDEVYYDDSPDQGIAEIVIGKQRNGPIGTVKLAFRGEYTKFENLAASEYDDYV